MAMRVGIDLTSTASVRTSLEAHGERYLRRVFTERELADCGAGVAEAGQPPPPPAVVRRLAARFAAKEAAFKVLRVDDQAVSWREVEVVGDRSGSMRLSLTGRAARIAVIEGIGELSLSTTHVRGIAAAVVIGQMG